MPVQNHDYTPFLITFPHGPHVPHTPYVYKRQNVFLLSLYSIDSPLPLGCQLAKGTWFRNIVSEPVSNAKIYQLHSVKKLSLSSAFSVFL